MTIPKNVDMTGNEENRGEMTSAGAEPETETRATSGGKIL
jgi:hypothetical protein